jgi:hypothetical protein
MSYPDAINQMRAKVLVLCFYLSTTLTFGQTFNLRLQMDTTTIETGRGVEETEGGYLFFTPWQYPLNVLKTGIHKLTYSGETVWKKSIGFDTMSIYTGYFGSTCIADEGFALGTSVVTANDENYATMVRFNSEGDSLFTSTIQVDGEALAGRSIVKTEDGFVMTGFTTENTQSSLTKVLLAKFDLNGELQWKRKFTENPIPLDGFSLIQTPDGGFLIGAAMIQAFNWDPMLIKTDANGFEEWRQVYGTQWNDFVAMVENTADGNFIFGSEEILNATNTAKPMITKVDPEGEVIWSKLYGDPGMAQHVNSIKLLPDGGFIACGVSNANLEDVMGFVLRIDADGNEYFFRKYYETEGNYCYLTDIIQDSQGYFVATGDLFPDPGISQDAWALRLDSCGCLVPECGGNDCLVGMDEFASEGIEFRVGPNPANQFMNVFLSGFSSATKDASLEVYDMMGKRIHLAKKVFDDTTHMIDVAGWQSGMYLVVLRARGEVIVTQRVEVVH